MKKSPASWGNSATLAEAVELHPVAGDLSELIGQRIGNYVIERRLGGGGMAVVFVAKHPTLEREVAVKFLNPQFQGDLELADRFIQEAKVTASLNHPNVVEILDFGDLEGRPYYIMELLSGSDLRSCINRRTRFHHSQVALYLEQICAALEVAHEKSIIHRDLKPANIFIREEEPPRIKLMDFGIAKADSSARAGQTVRGQLLGTPTHMSPEQAMGHNDQITPQSDVYAVGVVAYEMLTGRLPFYSESQMMLLTMHIRDAAPPIRDIAPDVPERVADLVHQCLAKVPEHRPKSARTLAAQFSAVSRVAKRKAQGQAVPSAQRTAPATQGSATSQSAANPEPQLALETTAAQPSQDNSDVVARELARKLAYIEKPTTSPASTQTLSPAASARIPEEDWDLEAVSSPKPSATSPLELPRLERTARDSDAFGFDSLEPAPQEKRRLGVQALKPAPHAPAEKSATETHSPESTNDQDGLVFDNKLATSTRTPGQETPPTPAEADDSPPLASARTRVAGEPPALLSELTDDPAVEGRSIRLTDDDGKTLERLLRRMQRRGDFPSFLNNMTEITTKADADSHYSASQLAEALRKDFGLTAKLLRIVNTAFLSRFGGKVYSVDQAVVILGFDSVRTMASGVSVYKVPGTGKAKGKHKTVEGKYNTRLAESAVNSLVSGEIARLLAERAQLKAETEIAMMAATFRNLGQHLVMQYLPEEYEKIEQLVEQQKLSLTSASEKVLGTSLRKLSLGVLEKWQLPKDLSKAISTNLGPEDKLEREVERLSALARFSTDLCNAIATGNRDTWERSIQRLLERNQNLLSLQEQEVTQLIGAISKSFEERFAAMFGPNNKRSRFLKGARELTGETDQPSIANAPLDDEAHVEIQAVTERLTKQREQRHAPELLLEQAIEALAKLFDSPRLVLLAMSQDRKLLEVKGCIGPEAEALQRELKLPLARSGDVFSTAMRNGKSVSVEDALAPAVTRRIPQRYYEVLGSPCFKLLPCVSMGYPTALLLVPSNATEQLPGEDRVSASKPLRSLLTQLVHRAR